MQALERLYAIVEDPLSEFVAGGLRYYATHLNLIPFLNDALNLETRSNLVGLEIQEGAHTIIMGGWAKKIGTLLPALQSLHIGWPQVDLQDFTDMCDYFLNLTKLCISRIGINSLEGLSKLKNLETLIMCDMEFEDYQDISDIFTLKELKVLDFSGEKQNGLKIVEQYLKHEKPLQKLRFLDCSRTTLTHDMLIELCKKHPNIEQIGVIVKLIIQIF